MTLDHRTGDREGSRGRLGHARTEQGDLSGAGAGKAAVTDFPPPPEPDKSAGDTDLERFRSFDVERLAAARRVQLRCAGGVTEPLAIQQACLERGVSTATLQSAFDAICVLCQRSPTRVFCRVSAAEVAALDAALSVTKVNRAVPLLAAFGLIVRRARHRGPWETTVPALVDAAAAPEGSLDELWDQPTAEAGLPPWPVPASVAEAASWVRMPEAALEAQPTRSCPCRPRCDLGEVIEQLVAVIGPQARDRSWQDDLHGALSAGYSAQYILFELTRDMHDARAPGGVARCRLYGMLGRPRRTTRHVCSDADQHAAAVSAHCQALTARQADWRAAEPLPGPSRGDVLAERPGFALERKHYQAAEVRRRADSAKPAATAVVPTGPVTPLVNGAVGIDTAEYRETSRKDLKDAQSPPQTPPHPTTLTTPSEEPIAQNSEQPSAWALAVVDEAAAIKSVEPSDRTRHRLAVQIAAHHERHDESAHLSAVLGLVAGTQAVRWPLRVMSWRAAHPSEAARYAGPMMALVAAGLGDSIRDPDAWLAVHHSTNRRAAARALRARESERRAEELADRGQRSAAAESEAAGHEAAAREQRAAGLTDAARALLGRRLHPAVERLVPFAAGSSLLLAMRRAVRLLGDIPGVESEIAAVLAAAERWDDLGSALADLPPSVIDPVVAEAVAHAAATLTGPASSDARAGESSVRPGAALVSAARQLGDDDLEAFVAAADLAGLSRADIGGAVTALASNRLLSASQRRGWAARLLQAVQSRTET